jgi:hypothetical protein
MKEIDILFMVDNSMGMDPKQKALAKAFPKLMDILQTLPTGPADMHIGVISSDMGGGCIPVLGNQGILWGNDPSVDPNFTGNKYATVKNLQTSAGLNGCGMNVGARWIEDVQSKDGGRSKNYQGNISDAFACLAQAVGVGGCWYEHPLQSLRVALNPIVGGGGQEAINPQNVGFLRRKATLAIVLVTDEDDCSADPSNDKNDEMFIPRTMGDTASLRCAARGHQCHGQEIPDYDPQTGYTGQNAFVAKFSDCDAKDDTDQRRLPLIRIRDMIDSVNQAKDRPSEMIFASGIIGWPLGDPAQVEYRIDKDLTALPIEQQKVWDYMPICQVPEVKSSDGNIYKAYGGLRLKKFLDAYRKQDETNLFSICNPDFSEAMTSIGNSLATVLSPTLRCVSLPIADADSDLPGIQPECQAMMKLSCDNPGTGDCQVSGYTETPVAQCWDGEGHPLDLDNPRTDAVPGSARPCWYLHQDRMACGDDPGKLMPKILTPEGRAVPAGTLLGMECMICPDGQPGCLF